MRPLVALVAALVIGAIPLSPSPTRAQGSFANWESPPVHPVDITPDGTTLLVANTADDRLEIFTLGGPLPVWTASVPVGLDPVSVRARTNGEVWVVNRMSDSVSIVDLAARNVVATLFPGDEPEDVIFAGAPQRAFVTVSELNQVNVYDPANRTAAPTVVPIQGNSPRSLATDGTRVYVAIFESGNRSMILPEAIVSDPSGPYGGQNPPPFQPPLGAGLPPPPTTSLIINKEGSNWKDDQNTVWDSKVTWNLNENDVAVIQVSDLSVTGYAKNLLNIDMALAVQPSSGKVTVVGTYGPNEKRFDSSVIFQFARNRMAIFDPANMAAVPGVVDLNQHLFANPPNPIYKTSATPTEQHLSMSDPRGIVWKADGSSAYVSGMGSNSIVRINLNGARQATIDVGHGPTGLALDTARSRVYCLNRFDGTVSSIDTTSDTEVGQVAFFDPTPAVIKTGRPFLYDSHLTSGLGNASCALCHVDATMDTESWDLGNPTDAMQTFDETCNQNIPFSGTCGDWHPMKGPMMTQTLIGSVGTEPLHWRGDRPDMAAFHVGFTGLLGAAAPPSPPQMQQLEDFIATIRFPPNPHRTFTDGLPASIPGLSGNPQNGKTLFETAVRAGGVAKCVDCHSGPSGGAATIVSGNVLGESQSFNVPQLRNLYKKVGLSFTSLTNNRGFGFGHDGSADTIFTFLQRPLFTFPAGAPGDAERHDIEAFLMAFPTDTYPAVGVQLTVDGSNKTQQAVIDQIAAMTALADTGVVGLVAKGVVGGAVRGYAYVAGNGFQSDRAAEVTTPDALRTGAAAGNEVTFTVVPTGTETRIGIDRDSDGAYDGDEIDAGTDPADASSFPSGSDTDGDGVANALDDCPTVADPSQLDADGDGPGDACDPCTNPTAITLVKPHLKFGKLGGTAGDENLSFDASLTVPVSPTVNAATNGFRLLVTGTNSTIVLDRAIPGGAGWKALGTLGWGFRNKLGLNGITSAKVKGSSKIPGLYKVNVKGKNLTVAVAPAQLPLTAAFILNAAGQCGERALTGPPPTTPACALNTSATTLRCK
ncbi:MAG TPA: hypothetical protein VGK30_10860 [Candidatus Binatia bacterium]|jgi:YVTN family beta-propeller protein